MRSIGILIAAFIWILSWLITPASWWLNERILDEHAFAVSTAQVLEIEDVDTEITNRATARVITDARAFIERNAPMISDQADLILARAESTVAGVVNRAVNSQPGEKAMLAMAVQTHNVFLAWLDQDALGRPGLQGDLGTDVQPSPSPQPRCGLGPIPVPLDALDIPGIEVPVPLPPDWMRTPFNFVRSAFIPALCGFGLAGIALVWLDRGRFRALAVVSALSAAACGGAAVLISTTWALTGSDSADWTITRAISTLLVKPWVTAYIWIVVAMIAIAVGALTWDRFRLVGASQRL